MSPGMLTFLFADLESSTRLWERFPRAMSRAMERHDQILRDAVEGADGRVVKHTGDGLMAVFASAGDAVSAALEAQRQLLREVWHETGPLRARIGLHSGEAQTRQGDYFGPPVYRAARIMSAGHGGQVLLSGVTAELVRAGGLPAGAGLRDLGEHRLKDLLEPERIFQLTHTELAADLPPLASLGRRPNNLPLQSSELIGRASELEELRRLLDMGAVRLLTLTGPGGIGKTRLALQAAAEQLDRFEQGVYFVDLSATRDRDGALAAIVRTLGLPDHGAAGLLDSLKDHLAERELLLLLDNFEQVMAAARAVGELVANCPALKLLVTSREALRVRGEQVFPLAPLGLPADPAGPLDAASIAAYEAVKLFVDRAHAAQPHFALSDRNATAVLEICQRLDGLPLALELGAARLKLFSPEELAQRLRSRLSVLRGGPRDLPARQQTLRGTIEWSFDLLNEDERNLFRLLSLFSGAHVEAVETVAGQLAATRHVDVLDALASLVDKSLLRSAEIDRRQRLSMLETIREYAGERLDDDPELAAAGRRAHASYYSGLAAEASAAAATGTAVAALDQLASELGNLEAAWRHWLEAGDLPELQPLLDALWMLHEKRGWYHAAMALATELLDVLGRTAPSTDRIEEELALRMSLARGLLAVGGYTDEVEEVYRSVLAGADAAGQLPRRLSVLRSLANFHLYRGDLGRTQEMGHQLLQLGEQEQDERLQLEGHFLVGVTTAFFGDVAAGQRHLARTIELFDPKRHGPARLRLGPSPGVTALTSSALLYWFTGRLDSAEQQAERALQLAAELNHPYSLAYARFHVGLYFAFCLRFERSKQLAQVVLDVANEHEYPIWRALGLVLLGFAIGRLGQAGEGLLRMQEGLKLYRGLTTPPIFWPHVLHLQADSQAQAGHREQAAELIDEAIAITSELDFLMPLLLLRKGDLCAAAGRTEDARAQFQQAYDSASRLGSLPARLQAATALVRLNPQAPTRVNLDRLRASIEEFDEGRDSTELLQARELLDSQQNLPA